MRIFDSLPFSNQLDLDLLSLKHGLPFDATLGNIDTSTFKHLVVERNC